MDPLQTILRQLTEEVRAMRRQADSHDPRAAYDCAETENDEHHANAHLERIGKP